MNRKIFPIIGTLLIILAVVASGCDSFSPPARTTSGGAVSGQSTGIWVSGEGRVNVVPDIATLTLGVEAQADTVGQAQSEASSAMEAVASELDSRGIADKDIQTLYYRIYPVRKWSQERGEEELVGYRATHMVTVKVREVDDTGAIIDAVAGVGGDYIRIDSISFTVDDPVPYQKEAREKALADAREKARQIADIAGVRLGEPTYINESGSYYPTSRQVSYGMAVPAPVPEAATSISPGETEITILVQVAYSIR